MSDKPTHFPNGDDLCRYVSDRCGGRVVLNFSNGKDSIGSWMQLKRHFKKITPVYRYIVPGLRFIEESLTYYEELFGEKILRYPEAGLISMLNSKVYQPPERHALLDSLKFTRGLDAEHIRNDAIKLAGGNVLVASGWRESDSLRRRLVIQKYGSLRWDRGMFLPIFDWTEKRLSAEFIEHNVQLPVDYLIFGRSFEMIGYRYLEPIRRYYPDDYERILFWFPLAALDRKRREFTNA